ncbi:DUF3160 domain-containing protein [Candidatus Oscillochloris fontis]|uniref:DUF3160 domain-containing protein n=1 Tax=Candidatus Oscillochloris fontis TaxID=2496868 RepID=UPI001375AC38|nr:DUF3160 domain-containing protein [Candidatus Oscillochloris fontis]
MIPLPRFLPLLSLLLVLVACTNPPPAPTPAPATTVPTPVSDAIPPHVDVGPVAALEVAMPVAFKPATGPGFASFKPDAMPVTASLQADPIAADLSNVRLTVMLSPEQRARLAENGFVISPGATREFYEIYERTRYENVPVFVSSDSLLHTYHLLFDKVLRRAESNAFIPLLTRLDAALLQTSLDQYAALEGTAWAEPARRNAAYFALAVKLLNPDWPVPPGLTDLVEPDLARIAAHAGMEPSAIFPGYSLGEDWSQYVPRGHYTTSEALQRYFTAMMWHGRMTFRVADATETRQAALLTLAYQQTQVEDLSAAQVWAGIYEPTVFFVGRSDDLTPTEYEQALASAYGQVQDPADLLDEASFAAFTQAVNELRAPEILGMLVSDDQDLGATKGLRFMGQRFVPDAFIFQQLVAPAVPERGLPSSLDVMAALGSERALGHLTSWGDADLPNYRSQLDDLRTTFAAYGEEVWTQNLYWTWVYSLRPLLEPVGDGYPQFMRSEAWLDKQLTTALASYTELKRDTILYAKQVYVEMGYDSLKPPDPERPKGYVEPVPVFYDRIAALTRMTIDGLSTRGLLEDGDLAALTKMEEIATKLATIARQQLRGEALSTEDYEYLRFYGGQIEALAFAASDEGSYQGAGGFPEGGDPLQAAVVADLATNPNQGVVLENGVGRVFEIYVVAPIEGNLVLTKGAVFSHYEFAQPLNDRLTDETWRELLDSEQVPSLADWTASYLVKQHESGVLEETIRTFNNLLVQAIWYSQPEQVEGLLGPQEYADTKQYIEGLKADGTFVGSKLISLEFRSFDLQENGQAIVTTRETWSDELYRGSPYFEEQVDGQPPALIGIRPTYTINATYTLRSTGDGWVIDTIVMTPEPPVWIEP